MIYFYAQSSDGQRTRGGSTKRKEPTLGLTARFKAWGDGRRGDLVRWWSEARARAWANCVRPHTILGAQEESNAQRVQTMQLARMARIDGMPAYS